MQKMRIYIDFSSYTPPPNFFIDFVSFQFLATCLVVVCEDFWTLAVYASVFGFTIGAYVGLTSVILVDLLGLDKLTNAFGLLLLFQGLASLAGPPIGGTFSHMKYFL